MRSLQSTATTRTYCPVAAAGDHKHATRRAHGAFEVGSSPVVWGISVHKRAMHRLSSGVAGLGGCAVRVIFQGESISTSVFPGLEE